MPGFVDANLSLSLESAHQAHRRKRACQFYDETLALLRSCLQHGTLAADVKASAGAEQFHADISVIRKLATIGSNPVRMIRTWRVKAADSTANQPADFEPTLDLLLHRKLIHFVEFSLETATAFAGQSLEKIKAARVGIKLLWPGGSPEELAQLLERLHPRSVCFSSLPGAAELSVLAQTPSIAVFATGKDVFEGPAGTAARRLVDDGGAVALSSGYASGSAASFSMLMSIALAVTRLGLTPEEAFSAATVNASYATGCAQVTGSIEAGKQADLLLLQIGDYRDVPRQFGINHVAMAIRQGNIVLNRTRWKAAAG